MGWGLPTGVALIAAGFLVVACTVALLATVGRGTLAPWDPASWLVARGIYRHVRNPRVPRLRPWDPPS